jgi:hypothetical protein
MLLPLLFLLWGTTAQAKLEITKIQAAYGPLGPERKVLEFYPNDEVFFRYRIAGAKVDDAGKLDLSVVVQVSAKGKVLFENKGELKEAVIFGGPSIPGVANVALSGGVIPGEYTLQVTVKDNHAGETASFQRTVKVKASTFVIVAPQFFYDAGGKVPAPAGGLVGQALFFKLRVIGLDRSKGKIDTTMKVEISEAEGQEGLLSKPINASFKSEDPAVLKTVAYVTYDGHFALNREGSFVLKITITDRVADKSTVFSTVLNVKSP